MADRRQSFLGLSLRCLIAALCLAASVAVAAEFVPGVEDLPLAPGLAAVEEASTAFDTPSGRIVEAEARGARVTEAEVRRFYAGTLPSLGWRAVDDLHYERSAEKLNLAFRRAGATLTVRFEIRPR